MNGLQQMTAGTMTGAALSAKRKDTAAAGQPAPMLSYGASVFVWGMGQDILYDLMGTFALTQACAVFVTAALIAQNPEVSAGRLDDLYRRSFLSRYCPGLSLSAADILHLVRSVGLNRSQRDAFFRRYLTRLPKKEILIVDSIGVATVLPDAGGEAAAGASLLFAWAVHAAEPVCAMVVSGQSVSAADVERFVRVRTIPRGLVIADKDFRADELAPLFVGNPAMHYLSPVFRSGSGAVNREKTRRVVAQLSGKGAVNCVKCNMRGRRFWYSLDAAGGTGDAPGIATAGSGEEIVYESDVQTDPKVLYRYFEERGRFAALVQRFAQSAAEDGLGRPEDLSLQGALFVAFIAAVLRRRMSARATEVGLLPGVTLQSLMRELAAVKRRSDAPSVAREEDGTWGDAGPASFEILTALGLCEPKAKTGKKRGRPRVRPVFVGPKRPRGRPRKTAAAEALI